MIKRGSPLAINVLPFVVLTCTMTVTTSAHDEFLHKEISATAFQSAEGLATFLVEMLGQDNAPFLRGPLLNATPEPFQDYSLRRATPYDWLKDGSFYEDMLPYGVFRGDNAPRGILHFYTLAPIRTPGVVGGLTDESEPNFLGRALPGELENSFTWASRTVVTAPIIGINKYSWPYARAMQHEALTSATKSSREEYLALMLYKLGFILHLNQDLSQPEHVRNDNHFLKKHIEKHGKKYLENGRAPAFHDRYFPKRGRGWVSWRDAGFTKLLDFWDRNKYAGSWQTLQQALDGDSKLTWPPPTPPTTSQLGLAEFCNGNFLGEDAKYRELVKAGGRHYYTFPSLNTSTDFKQVAAHVSGHARDYLYPDGTLAKRVYLRKNADGIQVDFHSRLTYLGVKLSKMMGPAFVPATTIKDENVLQNYHAILIPKAIEYSAGILDYFFRGQVEVICSGPDGNGQYAIRITNKSGQDLKGGQFQIFYDDAFGVRTPLTGEDVNIPYSEGSSLADGASLDASFKPPFWAGITGYILVYKGTIGTDANGAALDPVDEGIAVIAKRIHLCCGTGRIVPRYDNTTKVPDWHNPPGAAIDPYARPVHGEGEACGGQNEKPCAPWAPVPENTFAANGVIELGAPGAQAFNGFKAVQAKKAWHGRWGFDACPSTTPPTTKYRRVRRTVLITSAYRFSLDPPDDRYCEWQMVRDYRVNRGSGVIESLECSDAAGTGNCPLGDEDSELRAWIRTDYRCAGGGNPWYNPVGWVQDVLGWPEGEQPGAPPFVTLTRTHSPTQITVRLVETNVGSDPPPAYPYTYTVEFTATLDDAYSADACQSDLAGLLTEWNLADDALYPWRTDPNCTVAPLVTRDEPAYAVNPDIDDEGSIWLRDCSWTDPNGAQHTGAVRGAPLPAGYRRFFNFRHENQEFREREGWSGYVTISQGAWVPDYLPQNATQWTTANDADKVFLPCAHLKLLTEGVMIGMKRAETELPPVALVDAANTTPIVIEMSRPTGLRTGDRVDVSGVEGNTAANVTDALVEVVDATHFKLNGTAGNGNYTGGGLVRGQPVFVKGHFWSSDQSYFECEARRTTGPCGVLYFGPTVESFQNGFHGGWFPAPVEPTGLEIYSGSIRQFVADAQWIAPHDPCGAGNCRSCKLPLHELGGPPNTCACP